MLIMSAHLRTGACAICKHPDRSRIEALRLSGVSLRIVAKRFGLTGKDAVHYHFKRHVTPERRASLMLGAAKLEELVNQATQESRSLLERMNVATSILFSRFIACAEAGDDNALANIAGRLNTLFRDYAHLTGELRGASVTINQTTVNILSTPEFVALQSGLLALVRKYPEARADVVSLLRDLAKGEAPAVRPSVAEHGPPLIEGEAQHVA
jgi:hypothetical protein